MDNLFHRKDLIYTIAKEQSFSKAAQKLFVAQPSLSLMVKTLEEELGTPLFDRSSKPIRLTEAGTEYVRAAERIKEIERAYKEYILALNNLEAGSLRIGSNQLLSSIVLPKYIATFIQAHPKIKLSLMDANSTTLENEISNGALDIVIDNSLLPTDIFDQQLLATEHLLLAVPAGFSANTACRNYGFSFQDILQNKHIETPNPVPFKFFAQVPFILMNRNNDTGKLSNSIFHEAGFTPNVLFEQDRLTTLYSYVEQGVAASLVTDTLVRNIRGVRQESIIFYTLPVPHSHRNIYAYYKKNKFCTKAMTAFIDGLHTLVW